MVWSAELETGNEMVDDQHKDIIKLVQDVLDAGNEQEKVNTALAFLADYAVRHFACEEKLMLESDWHWHDEHKKQHDSFVKAVADFVHEYRSGEAESVVDTVNNFIIIWLKVHIMGSDRIMARHYRDWKQEVV